MSITGRLAKLAFSKKPAGIERSIYQLNSSTLEQIADNIASDAAEAAFSAAASYAEALQGIKRRSASWSVVKLYYSSFYSVKSFMILDSIIPFHEKNYYMLDLKANRFLKGGSSSHHLNWAKIQKIKRLTHWCYSQASQAAYEKLRNNREDSNYRLAFPDPSIPECIGRDDVLITRRIRDYRNDSDFFYTYLNEHLTLAYPTKLIFNLSQELQSRKIEFNEEKKKHLRSLWILDDRCLLS
jgi:hypothetical protein